jgi:predicted nucleic acid-binding Zn ribbon protein
MRKKQKNNKEFEHIGYVLNRVLNSYRIRADTELLQIWDLWETVVGGDIAKNAQPVAFKETMLLVHVNSSAWIHHLRFLKEGIISSVNQALGKELVREIKFKVGSF